MTDCIKSNGINSLQLQLFSRCFYLKQHQNTLARTSLSVSLKVLKTGPFLMADALAALIQSNEHLRSFNRGTLRDLLKRSGEG